MNEKELNENRKAMGLPIASYDLTKVAVIEPQHKEG